MRWAASAQLRKRLLIAAPIIWSRSKRIRALYSRPCANTASSRVLPLAPVASRSTTRLMTPMAARFGVESSPAQRRHNHRALRHRQRPNCRCSIAGFPVFLGPVSLAACGGNDYAGRSTWRHTPDRLRKRLRRPRPKHRSTHPPGVLSNRSRAAVTLVPATTSPRSSRHPSRTVPLHQK